MALQNIIEYDEIEEQINTLKSACEDTKTCLDSINKEITDSVGANGAVWSGDSAVEFRNSWDALAEELPTFITYVDTQVKNVQSMLSKTKETDQDGKVD